MAGTPKREMQLVNRALVQSASVIEESGIASGHRDVLSITVNWYVCSRKGGSGPTRSTWMWAKRYWNDGWLELDVSVYLASAEQACPGHLLPSESGRDEASCHSHSWVLNGVQPLEYRLRHLCRHLRQAERPLRNVPHRGNSAHCLGGDVQVVRGEHTCHFGLDCWSRAIAKNSTSCASAMVGKTSVR
jgi:hypothetical protein